MEQVPLSELTDEQLSQLAAGVNAELHSTPEGTPGRENLIKQWAQLTAESDRRETQPNA